jgi:hypothetical protein
MAEQNAQPEANPRNLTFKKFTIIFDFERTQEA